MTKPYRNERVYLRTSHFPILHWYQSCRLWRNHPVRALKMKCGKRNFPASLEIFVKNEEVITTRGQGKHFVPQSDSCNIAALKRHYWWREPAVTFMESPRIKREFSCSVKMNWVETQMSAFKLLNLDAVSEFVSSAVRVVCWKWRGRAIIGHQSVMWKGEKRPVNKERNKVYDQGGSL